MVKSGLIGVYHGPRLDCRRRRNGVQPTKLALAHTFSGLPIDELQDLDRRHEQAHRANGGQRPGQRFPVSPPAPKEVEKHGRNQEQAGGSQGEGRACSRLIWAEYLHVNDRQLRELVQSFRQDFGVAIGTAANGGYFLIATREEFDEAIRGLTLHAVTTLRVVKGMSGTRYAELLNQLLLPLLKDEVR